MPRLRLSKTTLQGFRPPVVNGGEIVLPVVVHAGGELHGLAATPRLWREIFASLAPCLAPTAVPAALAAPAGTGAHINTQEARRRQAAWEQLCAQPHRTTASVALEHGINPNTFGVWCNTHYRGQLRDLRRSLGLPLCPREPGTPAPQARPPITKPGGQLL